MGVPLVQPAPGLKTSAIGLGCANLFRLPTRQERLLVMETAYEGGVRHFDTAPMYGLGLSETELGRFAGARRDTMTIATKLGIMPTTAGRALGRVQGPIRRVLAAVPDLQRQAQSSAAGPSSSRAGSLLYRSAGYTADIVRSSLHASLRQLDTDYVDLLLLHDPEPGSPRSDDLCGALEAAVASGHIRTWGIAGEPEPSRAVARSLPIAPPVLQLRDDILTRQPDGVPVGGERDPGIVFGTVAGALRTITDHVRADPDRRGRWRHELDADISNSDTLTLLLLRDALSSHPASVVLFGTTKPARVNVALEAAATHDDRQLSAFRRLVSSELRSSNELGR